jgi:hypothetical protein
MARAMHNVVLKQMKMVLWQNKFISISCDEVTILDNQSWISVHAYVVENWRKQPILLKELWIEPHIIILLLLLFVLLLI